MMKQKEKFMYICIKLKSMKLLSILLVLLSCSNTNKTATTSSTPSESKTIYQFTVKDIEENNFDFNTLKGKKVMIVNTASKCGLTPQYEDLEVLYNKYKDQNFVIVGFPANNFMGQEPGSNEDIAAFCQKNYGVSFPMMSKISVKGKDMHPVYQYLTSKEQNGLEDNSVKWNFQKYLLNEEGKLEKVISPSTKPLDEEIMSWIEG